MGKSAEILDIFESFRKGMAAYFSEPAIPKAMKPRHSSVSARIAAALRPYFPAGLSIDIDLKGADILVHDARKAVFAPYMCLAYRCPGRRRTTVEKETWLLLLESPQTFKSEKSWRQQTGWRLQKSSSLSVYRVVLMGTRCH